MHKGDVQESTLTPIQEHESIKLGLESYFRPDFAVDCHSVTIKTWNPIHEIFYEGFIRIGKLTVFLESFVCNGKVFSFDIPIHFKDISLFLGNLGINNLIEPNKSSIHIQPGDSHSMIVVPVQSLLGVMISEDCLIRRFL